MKRLLVLSVILLTSVMVRADSWPGISGGDCKLVGGSGCTMTGTITTLGPGPDAGIIVPAEDGTSAVVPSIQFNTMGQEPSPWRLASHSAGTNDHDHVFSLAYNWRRTGLGTVTKDDPNSHAIHMGIESRFVQVGDPNITRGLFEWNIDIDPNIGSSTPSGTRQWFFFYDMDNKQTALNIGSGGINNDMYATFNFGAKCEWCFTSSDPNAGTIAHMEIGSRPLMGGAISSTTQQGRVIIDPGSNVVYTSAGDRAVILGNVSANMRLEPGIDPNGLVKEIHLSPIRTADVRVGGLFDSSRFSILGARDQTQFSLRGHSTQTTSLMTVANSAGTTVFGIRASSTNYNTWVGDNNANGRLGVDGNDDRVQLNVTGFTTQTNPLVNVETSAGTDIFQVKNAGTVNFVPMATAPATCAIGDMYVDTSGAYCACTATNTWTNMTALTGACT